MKTLGLLALLFGSVGVAFANDTPQDGWVDETHHNTKRWLNRTAHHIDDWFGKTDPNKPARASVRVMLDVHNDTHDGTTVKPRVRAKIKLPTLENQLSLVLGDDELDDEQGGGIYNDGRLKNNQQHTFDRHQSTKDNSSLALRLSKFKDDLGVQTDFDIGIRSSDVYARLRGEKNWQMNGINGRLEQVYRYGTKSEHYALTTLEFSQAQSDTRSLINRSHLLYTNKDAQEDLSWSNSFYQAQDWQHKLGTRSLSYGLYAGGDVNDDQKANLNSYGPYISYRQPIWREWLFVQGDVGYYNNKDENKDHHIATFGRLEMVF